MQLMPTQMKIQPALIQDQPQQIHASRLIIASNRGPVEYYLSQDKVLKHRRGAGGMVTALIDAGNRMEVTWVAAAMTEGDRIAAKEAQQQNGGALISPLQAQKMQLRYVVVSKSAYRKHYEGFSNQVLWFLQHYLYNPTEDSALTKRIQDAWTNGYCVANQAIADAVIVEIAREDSSAVVMLHDYHLYLAPAMIRKEYPSVIMQQFIHIPWPDIRCWHFLPSNITHAIYSGLVGNDIIGFQTERDARNFLDGARTLLEGAVVDFEEGAIWWQGRRTQVRAYPISISITEERRIVGSAAGKRASEKIEPLLGEKTIMRVDRIEPTKNILRGFQAYAEMLDEHPELLGQVKFLAFRENDRTRALAAMQWYDVLLVNPIIDGMNLVAKEGPVVNQSNGVLVLSRTAGAFQQLGKASIPTSPTNVTETAHALYKALMLPDEERVVKAKMARQAVERYDLNTWLTRQIADINKLIDRATPLLDAQKVVLSELAAGVG